MISSSSPITIGSALKKVAKWNPRKSSKSYAITYIDISSVDRLQKRVSEPVKVLTHKAPSRARQIVCAGDVLVSTVRPNLNAVAYIGSELDGATASTGFAILRPDPDKLNGRYLYHWVRTPSFIRRMTRLSVGASYPAVNDEIIKSSKIPLPSVAEQHRIAMTLDKADEIRRKREQSIQLCDQLLKSVFLEMFGDPVVYSHEEDSKSLADIVDVVGGGTPSKSHPEYYGGKILWITPKDMRSIEIDKSLVTLTDAGVKNSSTKEIPPYSVLLVVRSGVLKHTFPVAINTKMTTVNQDMKALICTEDITPHYLAHCLKLLEPMVLARIRATTADNIPMGFLSRMPIPLPPIERQELFSDICRHIRRLRGKYMLSCEMTLRMCASLRNSSFNLGLS